MRVALFADIHANMPAFEACLAAASKLNVDRLALLGDLVGYGPDPEAVVARAAKLVADGAVAVLGNHDQAALAGARDFNAAAAEAMVWTRAQLSEGSKRFLASLPLEVRSDDVLYVHADASDPGAWHYVTDSAGASRSLSNCQAQVTFCGHVHVPALYCQSSAGKMTSHFPVTGVSVPLFSQRKWLAVLGAVGQPRDGNPAAAFAVYDAETRALTYHRAAYDTDSVAQRIRDAGLPESLAARLGRGR
jgi:diadenosine tetraphosphatase ApaH/serine/threonine PP2A family protein phosphatase